MLVKKYDWAIQKSLFAETNQDSTFSHTRENSKILTLKYFSFFNNKPPASWVAHITRDFLTCYFCSYYISMASRSEILEIVLKLVILSLRKMIISLRFKDCYFRASLSVCRSKSTIIHKIFETYPSFQLK